MVKTLLLLWLLGLSPFAWAEDTDSPSSSSVPPGVAGIASIIPGLGQALAGRPGEGLAWFTGVVGGFALSPRGKDWPGTAFLDLWMYNVYDAYRDAGARRSKNRSLLMNYAAAFNPLNLVDPITVPVVAFPLVTHPTGPALASSKSIAPFEMAFIALGEEGLFRGFFFPGFSDIFHSPVAGAVLSSALFAYSHKFYKGQATYALKPEIFTERAALGLLMCLQTYAHHYDLGPSIFAHTWFDAIYEFRRAGGTVGGGGAQDIPQPTGIVYKYVLDF
jgi:membrane protease YdiL (CAAX protease family)